MRTLVVVVGALESGVSSGDEAVPHRVGEQRTVGIDPLEESVGAVTRRLVAGKDRPVPGKDQAPPHPQLLEQRALVRAVCLERVGVEHRPVRGEADECRKKQHDQPEEVRDPDVHRVTTGLWGAGLG